MDTRKLQEEFIEGLNILTKDENVKKMMLCLLNECIDNQYNTRIDDYYTKNQRSRIRQ